MRHLKTPPADPALFDLETCAWWHTQFAPNALRALREGWQGIFQRSVLQLMARPAEALGAHFDELLGRPTKELYALAGLLLIAEFKNLTIDAAAEAWSYEASVQYALNLPRDRQYLCPRTLDNYRRLLRENVDVQDIFTTVTAALIGELELDIRKQRLDSTHVLSAMAQLGRLQLLAVAVRRFLQVLRRHDAGACESLDGALRARYEPAETRLFGLGTRTPAPRAEALAQTAADLAHLVGHFAENPAHNTRASYLALARLLREHGEVREDQTVVREQSLDAQGGSARCLQNPSDPDAGYSGHKGPGHQVQLAQALPPRDAEGRIEGPGLLTACVPQSAAVRDSDALGEVLAQQQAAGLLPEQTVADTIYGSDANVSACAALGVTLLSPVGGVAPRRGGPPPVHHCTRAERELKARLAARREQQETDEWKRAYRERSGIEGINRALDATTGIKQLRVRGGRAVHMAVTLKATGWNIQAAAKTAAHRARRARRTAGSPQRKSSAASRRQNRRPRAANRAASRPRAQRPRFFPPSRPMTVRC